MGTDVLAVNPDMERGVGEGLARLTVALQDADVGITGIGKGEGLELLALVHLSLLPVLIVDKVALGRRDFANGDSPGLCALGIQEFAVFSISNANFAIGASFIGSNGLGVNPDFESSASQAVTGLFGNLLNFNVRVLVVVGNDLIVLLGVIVVKQMDSPHIVCGKQASGRRRYLSEGIVARQNAGTAFALQSKGSVRSGGIGTNRLTIAGHVKCRAGNGLPIGTLQEGNSPELFVPEHDIAGLGAVLEEVNVLNIVDKPVALGSRDFFDGVAARFDVGIDFLGVGPLNLNFAVFAGNLGSINRRLVERRPVDANGCTGKAVTVLVDLLDGTLRGDILRVRNRTAADEGCCGLGGIGRRGHDYLPNIVFQLAAAGGLGLFDPDSFGGFVIFQLEIFRGASISLRCDRCKRSPISV